MSRSLHICRKIHGVSLIELLVAITIGAVLIFGATQVYVDSRKTYEINESAARLQETARFALGVLEPDIRMANYWGLVKGAGVVTGQASQNSASVGAPTKCGDNFARDLALNLDGSNNAYRRNSTLAFTNDCDAYGASGPVGSSDTLTVRRASTVPASSSTGRLQICSTRLIAELVDNSSACTAAPAGQVNDLIVHAYYVSRDSVQGTGVPSLRRKTLIAGPDIRDDEIIPGIEDLQIQFGIDPTGNSGAAQRYVDPDAMPEGAQIVAVRLWLLVRSESREIGFTDDRIYEYADRAASNGVANSLNDVSAGTKAYQPNDGFRRLLVSRTIYVRNALGT